MKAADNFFELSDDLQKETVSLKKKRLGTDIDTLLEVLIESINMLNIAVLLKQENGVKKAIELLIRVVNDLLPRLEKVKHECSAFLESYESFKAYSPSEERSR